MAKSPLAELREMNVSKQREARGDAEPSPTPEPLVTDSPTDILTQVSNDLSNQVSKSISDDLRTSSSEGLSTQVSDDTNGGGEEVPTPAPARRPSTARRGPRPGPADGAAGYAGVKDRLHVGAAKEPLVRLSVDVSESLHTRIKQYCAVNRIPSGRMLIVTLLEDFLTSEGF